MPSLFRRTLSNLLLFFAIAFPAAFVSADDWPQWLGSNRDAIWQQAGVIEEFSAAGPDIAWSAECGLGYAGPSVAGGSVFLFDYVLADGTISNNPGRRGELNGKERLRCIDAASGETKWTAEYDCKYSVSYPSGPRCTPTVTETHVFTLGAMGHLTCVDRASGDQVWQVDMPTAFGAPIPIWGFAAHPLVVNSGDGKQLVVTMIGGPGQAVGAFDTATGELVWKTRDSKDAGYCGAMTYEFGGKNQIVAFSPNEVVALTPAAGEIVWSVPIEPDYGMSVNVPRKVGQNLLVTAYGKSFYADLSTGKPDLVWETPGPRSLYTCNSTPFVIGDVAIGCDINSGMVRAIALTDGSIVWETKEPVAPLGHDDRWRTRHATAFITRIADTDRFVLLNDLGEIVLCSMSQSGYSEASRAKVLEPTGEAFGRAVLWSSPAFADGAVFARNDKKLVRVNLAASN